MGPVAQDHVRHHATSRPGLKTPFGAARDLLVFAVTAMKTITPRAAALQELPNVGSRTARLLAAVGIRTPGQLRRVGAVNAALRVRRLRPDDPPCRSMLAGLVGAIRGVRWHALPAAERARAWTAYERRQAGARAGS